jgi:hypothetical protein
MNGAASRLVMANRGKAQIDMVVEMDSGTQAGTTVGTETRTAIGSWPFRRSMQPALPPALASRRLLGMQPDLEDRATTL